MIGIIGYTIVSEQATEVEPSYELKPDARLLEFQQVKTTELNQLNTELAGLQPKIDEKESEIEQMVNLIAAEQKRLIERYGILPLSMDAYSTEYIVASFKIGGVAKQLQQLQEQEEFLLATKQHLEEDIEEIKQYANMVDYHKFKLSQLEALDTRLVKARIEIDQKTLLKEPTAQLKHQYDILLLQRQLLQQDIKQIEQSLAGYEFR